MKYWYVIDKDNNLIYLKCRGKIKAEDFEKPTTDILSNVLFEKGMNTIVDLTEAKVFCEGKDITLFREFMESIQDIRGSCKWAIIAPKVKTYEFVELLSLISDELNIDIEPFRDYKNAVKWIMAGSLIN
jgi:hypothetical protein